MSAGVVGVDLASLTGQIGAVLTELRGEHGLAYRTRTWIEVVLPAFGVTLPNPQLTRDLLAVAALDAGGIRADVSEVARAHDREEIVTAAVALHTDLQRLLEACRAPGGAMAPPLSDRSCWPAWIC